MSTSSAHARVAGCQPEGGTASPALSVVIPTVDQWPTIKATLDSVYDQARSIGAEVVVVDGHGNGLPDEVVPSEVVRVCRPGCSINQARALGLAEARGEIIAVTEDHCIVAADWCRCILAAFEHDPEVMVVGGAVENAATATLLDHMHFLLANGPSMRPLGEAGPRSMSGQANVSYRREVLGPVDMAQGVLQMQLNRDLGRSGVRMRLDDRLLVWHDQSVGTTAAMSTHFHNGRCIAGFRRNRLTTIRRVLRIGSCAVLPGYLVLRVFLTVFRKRRLRSHAILGLPLLLLLGCCHAVGELVVIEAKVL